MHIPNIVRNVVAFSMFVCQYFCETLLMFLRDARAVTYLVTQAFKNNIGEVTLICMLVNEQEVLIALQLCYI